MHIENKITDQDQFFPYIDSVRCRLPRSRFTSFSTFCISSEVCISCNSYINVDQYKISAIIYLYMHKHGYIVMVCYLIYLYLTVLTCMLMSLFDLPLNSLVDICFAAPPGFLLGINDFTSPKITEVIKIYI